MLNDQTFKNSAMDSIALTSGRSKRCEGFVKNAVHEIRAV